MLFLSITLRRSVNIEDDRKFAACQPNARSFCFVTNPQTEEYRSCDRNVRVGVFMLKNFLYDRVWTAVNMKLGRICIFDVQFEVRAERV